MLGIKSLKCNTFILRRRSQVLGRSRKNSIKKRRVLSVLVLPTGILVLVEIYSEHSRQFTYKIYCIWIIKMYNTIEFDIIKYYFGMHLIQSPSMVETNQIFVIVELFHPTSGKTLISLCITNAMCQIACGDDSSVPREGFILSVIISASLFVYRMFGCRHSLLRLSNISCFLKWNAHLRIFLLVNTCQSGGYCLVFWR